jgi:hypothetical protein
VVALAFGMHSALETSAQAETLQTTLRAQHSGKCLTVHPGDLRNGAVAYQWTCGSGNNIGIVDAGAGWHYVVFIHTASV